MSESAGGVDIDIYADVEEFKTDDGDAGDLYDDVLTSSDATTKDVAKVTAVASDDASAGSLVAASSAHLVAAGGRRFQIYIGNLTWWTTDQDIQDEVSAAGVGDFLEVKFYENRANGQSKGFCCVSLGSEASMRVVMEKLPKKELHGQTPVVTYATKQALLQFESQSKTRPDVPPPTSAPPPVVSSAPPRGPAPMVSHGPPPHARSHHHPGVRGPPRGPPPVYGRPPPRHPVMHHHHHHPPPGAPPHHSAHHIRPPPVMGAPPPGIPPAAPPPVMHGLPPMGLPPASGPAPHVNPAFFPHGPPPASSSASVSLPHGLSEHEFEDIMGRNRTVSSSAIARAVQDAANGEYASAIETLVTAISLIKQSKVAGDDRCKILVSSLQDTLHGIESKSYSRSRERDRERHHGSSRRRSYSREREYHHREREYRDHHHHHYKERSRSRDRERDYRREEKYYEEKRRYEEHERRRREEERERERERERVAGESSSRSSRREEDPRQSEREKSRH